jgi:hypothetical protein
VADIRGAGRAGNGGRWQGLVSGPAKDRLLKVGAEHSGKPVATTGI